MFARPVRKLYRYKQKHVGHTARNMAVPLLVTGLLLAGCASTRSTDLADGPSPVSARAPSHIIVVVSDARLTDAAPENRERRQIAAMLQAQLTRRMKWSQTGVTVAEAIDAAAPIRNTLLLRVTITRVRPGNQALRLAIGFGAGRAMLRMNSQLIDLRGRLPVDLTAFDTRSTTGSMPGPGLGLVGAASTGSIIGIAGGSAGLLLGSRETMNREIRDSSAEIITHLQSYFGEQGWPAFSHSGPSALRADNPLPPPQPLL